MDKELISSIVLKNVQIHLHHKHQSEFIVERFFFFKKCLFRLPGKKGFYLHSSLNVEGKVNYFKHKVIITYG